MRYVYPCNIVRDVEEERATGREAYVVTFPDVYGANTGGWSWGEALEMAKDCLGVALGMYVKAHEAIPTPSQLAEGQVPVSVAPVVAAKLALYAAMKERGVTNVALAVQLGMQETAVRRLLDPGHRSHIASVEKALEAVGRSLVVEDRAIPTSTSQSFWNRPRRLSGAAAIRALALAVAAYDADQVGPTTPQAHLQRDALLKDIYSGRRSWDEATFQEFLADSPEISDADFWHVNSSRADAYFSMKGIRDLADLLIDSVSPKLGDTR